MIITLDSTTSAKISAALLRARHSAGSPAQGMVLTLIVVCDRSEFPGALEASMAAGREHPSRILLVVTSGGRPAGLAGGHLVARQRSQRQDSRRAVPADAPPAHRRSGGSPPAGRAQSPSQG